MEYYILLKFIFYALVIIFILRRPRLYFQLFQHLLKLVYQYFKITLRAVVYKKERNAFKKKILAFFIDKKKSFVRFWLRRGLLKKEFYLLIGKYRFIRRYSDILSLLKFLLLFIIIIFIFSKPFIQNFLHILSFIVLLVLFFIEKKGNILRYFWLSFAIIIIANKGALRSPAIYYDYIYLMIFIIIFLSIINSNKHIS